MLLHSSLPSLLSQRSDHECDLQTGGEQRSRQELDQASDEVAKFTGSQINYYFICKRKLWLFSHNIELEPESDLVRLGKLLHENRYKRKFKEVQIGRIKVDFMENVNKATTTTPSKELELEAEKGKGEERRYERATTPDNAIPDELASKHISPGPRNKELVIHEVKRSKKMHEAHVFQLLYYMYYLGKNYAVDSSHGVLHYPLLKQSVDVYLTEERIKQIEDAIRGIEEVNSRQNPPQAEWKRYCRSCAYADLCWG